MKNSITALIILFMGIFITSCSDDDDTTFTPPSTTIADFVEDNEDFSLLFDALVRTELDVTLRSNGSFTVFAPNNAAFTAFLGQTNLDDVPTETLTQILLNHVLGSEKMAADLATGYEENLAQESTSEANLNMYFNVSSDGIVINGTSTVTQSNNIETSNGIIHAVDQVIPLPTVTTFAVADPTFGTLATALTTLTPDTDYAAVLSGTDNAPFTVFAPTNDAFDDLLDRFGLDDFSALTAEQLEIVLNYHVIAGQNLRSSQIPDLPEGETPATLQGEILEITTEEGGLVDDKTGVSAQLVVTDVQTSNGVIHVVDKVLLPDTALDALGRSVTATALNAEGFTFLTAALYRTGLNDVLDRPGTFTVFAPTDDAFSEFLGTEGLDGVSVEVLTQVLLNHVIVDESGALTASDITGTGNAYNNTLANYGDNDEALLSIYINTDNGVVLNGMSTVVDTDIETRNGIIHAVDQVIDLPTVVTFATADPNFSVLAGALTTGTPSTDYATILSTANGTDPAPFTVFAPINQAFVGVELPADENDLKGILDYHVVDRANVRSTDLMDGAVTTLNGDVTIDAAAPSVKGAGNDTASNIIVVDVQAANGVIHAIDQILLPSM